MGGARWLHRSVSILNVCLSEVVTLSKVPFQLLGIALSLGLYFSLCGKQTEECLPKRIAVLGKPPAAAPLRF